MCLSGNNKTTYDSQNHLFDVLQEKDIREGEIWYCKTKKTDARAIFEGSRLTILAGSVIDTDFATSWEKDFPSALVQRQSLLREYGIQNNDVVVLKENVSFKSPNQAGGFAAGRSINAWVTWKNKECRTMDDILR